MRSKSRVPQLELTDEQCRSIAVILHRAVREQMARATDLEARLVAGMTSTSDAQDVHRIRDEAARLKDAAIKLLDYGDELVRLETGMTPQERGVVYPGTAVWDWYDELDERWRPK